MLDRSSADMASASQVRLLCPHNVSRKYLRSEQEHQMAFAVVVDELSVVQESGIGRDQSAVTQYICTAQRGTYETDRVQVGVVWMIDSHEQRLGVQCVVWGVEMCILISRGA